MSILDLRQKIVSLAIAVTPFTQLRLEGLRIGVSEIMVIFYFITLMISNPKLRDLRSTTLLVLIYLGFLFFFLMHIEHSERSMKHIIAYTYNIFFAIALVTDTDLDIKKIIIEAANLHILLLGTSLILFTFIFTSEIAIITNPIEGIRFMGLSENPNQEAFAALFLLVSIYILNQNDIRGILTISSLLAFIIFLTRSDAAILSLMVAVLAGFYTQRRNLLGRFALIILLSGISLIIIGPFIEFYEQLSSGQTSARFRLWANGLTAFLEAPYFGNGLFHQSGYNPFMYKEAHNLYIDLISMVGLFGFIYFIFLFVCLVGFSRYSFQFLPLLISVSAFSVFHFTLRSPIFWISMLLPVLYKNYISFYQRT